jgi:hypothetical protein
MSNPRERAASATSWYRVSMEKAVEFLLGGEDVQPLVRGFEADVDDVGTLVDHPVDVRGGLAVVVEDARLVRRLLGDVEHAHDPRRIVVPDTEAGSVHVSHVSEVGRDDQRRSGGSVARP